MYARAALFAGCFVVVGLATRPCRANDESPPAEAAELLVTGTALLPDGSPAAGAVVRLYDYPESTRTTTADGFGKFVLKGPCLSGLRLHALTLDEHNQAVVFIPEDAVRSHLTQPLTISLQPAKPHQVVVNARGQPVKGARVSMAGKMTGYSSLQAGLTGANGTATIWLPAGEPMLSVVAWHPEHGVAGTTHGVNGTVDWGPDDKYAKTELSLLPPSPYVVRVLDSEGRPVAGRAITTNFPSAEGEWIYAQQIDATLATTDKNGEAHFDWFPKRVKYVNVNLSDRGWKIDKIDNDKTPDGLTTVYVRRKFPVQGRLIFPASVDPQGILINGWIDRHHELLQKDLVIVELTAGLDTDANEIGNEIGGAGEGVPFHAMLSADGQVLVSSKGPQGNIGMPDSTDSRHFRMMLEAARRNMTLAEVDKLIESLKEDD
jgi:hypothetical protein